MAHGRCEASPRGADPRSAEHRRLLELSTYRRLLEAKYVSPIALAAPSFRRSEADYCTSASTYLR